MDHSKMYTSKNPILYENRVSIWINNVKGFVMQKPCIHIYVLMTCYDSLERIQFHSKLYGGKSRPNKYCRRYANWWKVYHCPSFHGIPAKNARLHDISEFKLCQIKLFNIIDNKISWTYSFLWLKRAQIHHSAIFLCL